MEKKSQESATKTDLMVWVRAYAVIDLENEGQTTAIEIAPEVALSIYRTEESAREAKEMFGGIILQVAASSLRGQHEFDDSLLLSPEEEEEAKSYQKLAWMKIVYGQDIPYEWNPKKMAAKFAKGDGYNWLVDFERASGMGLTQ